jgi:hypothetical protein
MSNLIQPNSIMNSRIERQAGTEADKYLQPKLTTSSQTIAKPNVIRRFDSDVFTTPFRIGRKQKRAILDANGIAVIIMPHNSEIQAQLYCDYLNGV